VNRRFGGAGMRRGLRKAQRTSTSTAFNPLIRADLVFDCDASVGVTLDGSTRVQTLTMAVGGVLDQTANATARPAWQATGLLSLPTMSFDGGDFLLSTTATVAQSIDQSQAVTTYVLADRTTAARLDTYWSIADSGSSQNVATFGTNAGGNDLCLRGEAAANTQSAGSGADGGAVALTTWTYSGSAYSSWIGSTPSLVAGANTRVPVCDQLYVGGVRFAGTVTNRLLGLLSRILTFNTVHDAATRAQVWAWFMARYPGLVV
jgi:hypothetical protein